MSGHGDSVVLIHKREFASNSKGARLCDGKLEGRNRERLIFLGKLGWAGGACWKRFSDGTATKGEVQQASVGGL